MAGPGAAVAESYDAAGLRRSRVTGTGAVRVVVLPGGFTVVRR